MRIVIGLAIVCFGLVSGVRSAAAQQPGFAPYGSPYGYSQVAPCYHHANSPTYQYVPHQQYQSQLSNSPFHSGYGAFTQPYGPAVRNYGGGNYGVNYDGGYGGGLGYGNALGYANGSGYGQVAVPQAPVYYSNTYNVQPAQHGWHLGHYLLGN